MEHRRRLLTQPDKALSWPCLFFIITKQRQMKEEERPIYGEEKKNEHLAKEFFITSQKANFSFEGLGIIGRSQDTENALRNIWKNDIDIRETFLALYLSQSNKIIGYSIISMGGISSTIVDVRLILLPALRCLASALIIAHNHPSGTLKPSRADIEITKKIKEASKVLDITLLDHIILTEESYFSFADEQIF